MAVRISGLNDPKLVELLNNGSVGVMPADTVYGIMGRASDEKAVARLYKLKSREKKPGTVIAASADQLVELGLPARYVKPVAHFWPNPISIEIPHKLEYLHQGTGRQAFRVVNVPELAKVLEQTGPLLTSSANHPGEKPANTVEEAEKYFKDEVDFYVDGRDMSGRPPSTIIRVLDDEIEVIRQGAVKINELGEIEQ